MQQTNAHALIMTRLLLANILVRGILHVNLLFLFSKSISLKMVLFCGFQQLEKFAINVHLWISLGGPLLSNRGVAQKL